jgi:hypothetical protein
VQNNKKTILFQSVGNPHRPVEDPGAAADNQRKKRQKTPQAKFPQVLKRAAVDKRRKFN